MILPGASWKRVPKEPLPVKPPWQVLKEPLWKSHWGLFDPFWKSHWSLLWLTNGSLISISRTRQRGSSGSFRTRSFKKCQVALSARVKEAPALLSGRAREAISKNDQQLWNKSEKQHFLLWDRNWMFIQDTNQLCFKHWTQLHITCRKAACDQIILVNCGQFSEYWPGE
jgi:hypothetical protein